MRFGSCGLLELWCLGRRKRSEPAYATHLQRSRSAGLSIWPVVVRRTDEAPESVARSMTFLQRQEIEMTPKNTICLWYDGTALEAATLLRRDVSRQRRRRGPPRARRLSRRASKATC